MPVQGATRLSNYEWRRPMSGDFQEYRRDGIVVRIPRRDIMACRDNVAVEALIERRWEQSRDEILDATPLAAATEWQRLGSGPLNGFEWRRVSGGAHEYRFDDVLVRIPEQDLRDMHDVDEMDQFILRRWQDACQDLCNEMVPEEPPLLSWCNRDVDMLCAECGQRAGLHESAEPHGIPQDWVTSFNAAYERTCPGFVMPDREPEPLITDEMMSLVGLAAEESARQLSEQLRAGSVRIRWEDPGPLNVLSDSPMEEVG